MQETTNQDPSAASPGRSAAATPAEPGGEPWLASVATKFRESPNRAPVARREDEREQLSLVADFREGAFRPKREMLHGLLRRQRRKLYPREESPKERIFRE